MGTEIEALLYTSFFDCNFISEIVVGSICPVSVGIRTRKFITVSYGFGTFCLLISKNMQNIWHGESSYHAVTTTSTCSD